MASQLEPRIVSMDDGPAYWFLNGLYTMKATTESTGGAFSLLHEISPAGHGTPYHLHHIEDEAFWVLGGSFAFFCDGKKTIVGPGGYVFLPRGIPHGIRVEGSSLGEMLILATPGTGFVGMMQEMSVPAKQRVLPAHTEPDMEKLTRLCAKYQIDLLGPLPE